MIVAADRAGGEWPARWEVTEQGVNIELDGPNSGIRTITIFLDHAEVGKLLLSTISLMANLYDAKYVPCVPDDA